MARDDELHNALRPYQNGRRLAAVLLIVWALCVAYAVKSFAGVNLTPYSLGVF